MTMTRTTRAAARALEGSQDSDENNMDSPEMVDNSPIHDAKASETTETPVLETDEKLALKKAKGKKKGKKNKKNKAQENSSELMKGAEDAVEDAVDGEELIPTDTQDKHSPNHDGK